MTTTLIRPVSSTGRPTLRTYQREAIDAATAAWARGVAGGLEVLPTGSGKTVVFSGLTDEWLDTDGHGQRALLVAHRDELLAQARAKFLDANPGQRVGIVAGQQNDAGARIVCASVQTLGGRDDFRRRMILDVGLVIVDEAHHATAPSYRRLIDYYVERGAKLIGFTATASRGDGAALGDVWTEVVYSRSIAYMIANGYLVRPRGVRVHVADLDLEHVKRAKGDYQSGELGEALEQSLAPTAIAKAIAEQARDRQGIIFAPTVRSATVIADAVREAGFSVDVIHGKMPREERAAALQRFRDGRTQWLANCMVLTEGTDLPCAEVCVIARPTSSVGLYVQMVGRVLRPYPGKSDALILDVVGATRRHRLASPIDLFGEDRREQDDELAEAGIDRDELVEPDDDEPEPDDEPDGADGPLVFTELDLFRSSELDWHRTDAGVWFVAGSDRLVALIPGIRSGTWDVHALSQRYAGVGSVLATAITDQAYARSIAESMITPAERTASKRDRSWKRAGESSSATAYARRLGIEVAEGTPAGQVHSLITQRLGTDRIDPRLPWYARGR